MYKEWPVTERLTELIKKSKIIITTPPHTKSGQAGKK